MEENTQDYISFSDICQFILSKLKIIIAITLVITIASVLFVSLVVNRNFTDYLIEYSYEYPNDVSEKYPDGQTFRYTDCLSQDVLKKIVNDNDKFASINVEKMYGEDNQDIRIERKFADIKVGSETTTEVTYVLRANAKYFTNKGQAAQFLKAVAEYPIYLVNQRLENADAFANLKAFTTAQTYEEKLAYLAKQQKYLQTEYNALMTEFGEGYEFETKTLKEYETGVALAYSELEKSALESDLLTKGYIYGDEQAVENALQILRMKKENLLKEKEDNLATTTSIKTTLSELSQSATSGIVFSQMEGKLTELLVRFVQIERELSTIEKQLAPDRATAEQTGFSASINNVYTRLTAESTAFELVRKDIYNNESTVLFATVNAQSQGDFSPILIAIVSVVLGFVFASFATFVVDYLINVSKKK